VAALVRLHARRRAHLGFPVRVRTEPETSEVPAALTLADLTGARHLGTDTSTGHPRADVVAAPPVVAAPIGLDTDGGEVSLFDLPGPGLALIGAGGEPVARAILATALATGVLESTDTRPIVVTTAPTLARLLPDGDPLTGLDPDGTAFDGERFLVLPDLNAAVTHAEEEMITRRRLLDRFDLESVAELNARPELVEYQPAYVLLIDASPRHAARVHAVGAHRAALRLHPILLGAHDGIPTVEVSADGTPTTDAAGLGRLATLTAPDLAAVLAMVAATLPRPEAGIDLDAPPAPQVPAPSEVVPISIPARSGERQPPVRLTVLGAVTLTTEAGPITTGLRSGSCAVFAVLAAHPDGRTLEQLAAYLHPDIDADTAIKRIRTDISAARRVLRETSGDKVAKFAVFDTPSDRYRIDPDDIEVDLWGMLAAIERANTAPDDPACLAALREAASLYGGDFAAGDDRAWAVDYATCYRHQILSVYARIAELLEADHPDQAIAALETAIDLDPLNEELYQRVMRVQGRQHRPDAVRRTLQRLEARLFELGDVEPSKATRRVAERQLRPNPVGGRR
jgi:DNA-binding SARP family transcriptional activator